MNPAIPLCPLCQQKVIYYNPTLSGEGEYHYRCFWCEIMGVVDKPAFFYIQDIDGKLKNIDLAVGDKLLTIVNWMPRTIFYQCTVHMKWGGWDIERAELVPESITYEEISRVDSAVSFDFNKHLNRGEFEQRWKLWMTFL